MSQLPVMARACARTGTLLPPARAALAPTSSAEVALRRSAATTTADIVPPAARRLTPAARNSPPVTRRALSTAVWAHCHGSRSAHVSLLSYAARDAPPASIASTQSATLNATSSSWVSNWAPTNVARARTGPLRLDPSLERSHRQHGVHSVVWSTGALALSLYLLWHSGERVFPPHAHALGCARTLRAKGALIIIMGEGEVEYLMLTRREAVKAGHEAVEQVRVSGLRWERAA